MFDIALSNAGSQVVLATSSDEHNPPEYIIDGKSDTFWSSTGLYPQEFIITFQSLMNLNNIKITCLNVKNFSVERSVQEEPVDFEAVGDKELERSENQPQSGEVGADNTTARHLRFNIQSGYDHFVAVYRVNVNGSAVN